MTIASVPLLQLLDGSRVVQARNAIQATIEAILPGVTVKSHPGKLDINDYVAKAIVNAPGVAVGYTRLRQVPDPAGTWSDVVDFVAYVVVDDLVDRGTTPPTTHPRELVAHAIGGRILLALRDPRLMFWGINGIEPPGQDPGPALVPVFTVQADKSMTAVYAVTWSQALANDGASMFGGPAEFTPTGARVDPDIPDELVFDLPQDAAWGDLPPELQAQLRRDAAPS